MAKKTGLLKLAPQMVFEIKERSILNLPGMKAINNTWEKGGYVSLDALTLFGWTNLAILARCHCQNLIVIPDRTGRKS